MFHSAPVLDRVCSSVPADLSSSSYPDTTVVSRPLPLCVIDSEHELCKAVNKWHLTVESG